MAQQQQPPSAHAVRTWRALWQGRVRVALNEANRAVKDWETAVREGGLAAAGVGNASMQEDSLPSLPLGVLADMGPALLTGAAAQLRARAAAQLDALRAALATAQGAADRATAAAASLSTPPAPGDPVGVPVFGCLSLQSLAGCFQRVAAALAAELALKKAVVAEVERVVEDRADRRQRKADGASSGPAGHGRPPLAGEDLRARFLVCVTAWKLQPEHAAGCVAAELRGVTDEMAGF